MFSANRALIYMTHVTWQFHRVRPEWFPSLWYVRQKQCTYLAPTLTLSPNGPKWDSTWPMSPRSTIGSIQNDFWAYGTLAQIVHLSCTYTDTIFKWTEMRFHITHAPKSSIGCIQNNFRAYGMFGAKTVHLLCVKISTIYKRTETSFHLSLVT
jgi:hypothetical protein